MSTRAEKILRRSEEIPQEREASVSAERQKEEAANQIKQAEFEGKTSRLKEGLLRMWQSTGLLDVMEQIGSTLEKSEVDVSCYVGYGGDRGTTRVAESDLRLKWNIFTDRDGIVAYDYVLISCSWNRVSENFITGEWVGRNGMKYWVNGKMVDFKDIDEKIALVLTDPSHYERPYDGDLPANTTGLF